MKTAKIFTPSGGGERDNHPQLKIHLHKISDSASDSELDHAGDIDYIGKVGNNAFGIQIKPITASANFGNYNISDRMSASFNDFEAKYGGKVFIVFSSRSGSSKVIRNEEVLEDIRIEIERLKE
jgi:hypothetical protein